MKLLKIWFLKRRATAHKKKFLKLCKSLPPVRYRLGMSISEELYQQVRGFNHVMNELAKLDPSTSDERLSVVHDIRGLRRPAHV